MIWWIMFLVFVAGCLGGLVAGLFSPDATVTDHASAKPAHGRAKRMRGLLVQKNPECQTLFPSVLGSLLLGGVAAVVFWGLYGPLSGVPIVGSVPASAVLLTPHLTVGQLAGSIIMGIGGPAFLQVEAQRRCIGRTPPQRLEDQPDGR